MLTSSCYKVWFILFVVNKSCFCQFSPCPNIFKHIFDGSGWFGMVDLEMSPGPGQPFKLIVEMSGNGTTPINYQHIGTADLKISQTDEKMEYKIKFPVSPAYPKFSSIVVNDDVKCSQASDGYPIVTVLRLEVTGAGQITFGTSVTGITTPLLMEDSKKTNKETSDIKNQNNNRNKKSIYTNCGEVAEGFEQSPASMEWNGELEEGIWPWLAAVVVQNNYICAGTLITNNAVITAARCVRDIEGAYVYLGVHDLDTINQTSIYLVNINSKLEEQGIIRSLVTKIHVHPNYRSGTADGDIAILQFYDEIEFSDNIQPACLWAGSTELNDIVEDWGYYAGWNEPKNDTKADTPFRLASEIISQEDCFDTSSFFSKRTSYNTFCAKWYDDEDDCPVYRGTGFLIRTNKNWVLRGIMSRAPSHKHIRCGNVKLSIFTDVAQYLDWIKEVTD